MSRIGFEEIPNCRHVLGDFEQKASSLPLSCARADICRRTHGGTNGRWDSRRLSEEVDISKLTQLGGEHLRKRNGSDYNRIAAASDAEGDLRMRSIQATEYAIDAAAG